MTDQPHHEKKSSASYSRSLGITQRANPLTVPWSGELKVRFSDFQVNEIGDDGNVVHLRTIGLGGESVENNPSEGVQQVQRQKEDPDPTRGHQKATPIVEIQSEDAEALATLTSQDFAQTLIQMFKEGPPENGEKKEVTAPATDDRQKRGQIHQEIRRIFQSRVETSTDDSGAIKAMILPPRTKSKRRGGRNQGPRQERPAGEHLHFTLYKDNRDTLDAVNQIARFMKIKPQMINYAGTKDRRASTVQRCSVRNQREKALAGINGKLWGVVTGDYQYKDTSIHLGQLSGNEFTIIVKNCHVLNMPDNTTAEDTAVTLRTSAQSALQNMEANGWINYFGHQRFGTHEIGTHEIGKLLLSDRFEDAVNSILSYDPAMVDRAEKGEIPTNAAEKDVFARHQACMLFQTNKDVQKAVQIMPRRFSAETSILKHLTRQGEKSRRDFIGAIKFVTRGLRTMYLHAYQSIVWNHVASKRWELYGSKVIEGDLVLVETKPIPLIEGQDEDGYDIINPAADADDQYDDDDRPSEARPLTEEEARSGKYTIHDIVLPSPGYEVIYPANEIGRFYEEFMRRQENGELDPSHMRRKHREFSLPGRYRKLMNRFLAAPSLEVKLYRDDMEQMHPTDLDALRASEARKSQKRGAEENGGEENAEEPAEKKTRLDDDKEMKEAADDGIEVATAEVPSEANGKATMPGVASSDKLAVIVKFQLGRSAYATVALRELMGDPPEEKEQ